MDPDPDPNPAIFVIDLQDGLLIYEVTFTFFFADIKSKRGYKAVEIKFFLIIFAW